MITHVKRNNLHCCCCCWAIPLLERASSSASRACARMCLNACMHACLHKRGCGCAWVCAYAHAAGPLHELILAKACTLCP